MAEDATPFTAVRPIVAVGFATDPPPPVPVNTFAVRSTPDPIVTFTNPLLASKPNRLLATGESVTIFHAVSLAFFCEI
jgi:hypothetical protein